MGGSAWPALLALTGLRAVALDCWTDGITRGQCCNAIFGPGGNSHCWDGGDFTFESCCGESYQASDCSAFVTHFSFSVVGAIRTANPGEVWESCARAMDLEGHRCNSVNTTTRSCPECGRLSMYLPQYIQCVRLEQARATPSASCPACSGADRATDGGGAIAIVGGAHYPTLLRPRSEGREFSLLATAFDMTVGHQLISEGRWMQPELDLLKAFLPVGGVAVDAGASASSVPAEGSMAEEPGEPEEILTPLERVAKLPWEKQEKIYAMLLRVLERLRDQPEEPKFRSLSAKGSKLQELLEPPGGESLLLWCGFVLQGDRYLAAAAELDFGARHEELMAHATRERDTAFRAARDQRIEAEKLKALPTGDFGPPLRRWGGRLPGFGFGAHRLASAGMQCSKIMTRVSLPLDPRQPRGFQLLDLAAVGPLGPSATYQLSGVVQHIGSTPFSGHYVAYCWHHASNRWHCFDDAKVRPVDPATVLEALNEAYVFFFEQVPCA